MADELDPNAALFGGDEPEEDPQEALMKQLFGKNPNRTSALSDLFYKEMLESLETEEALPEEAIRQLIFKMAINSAFDIVMECLDADTAYEVSSCLDSYIGMSLVNKKYGVDLIAEMRKALMAIKQEDGEDDEQFEKKMNAAEEGWWYIGQPRLDMRNPNDAMHEAMRKYGLE